MLDLVIIGAGPAGLTAAIYAMRAGLSTVLLEGSAAGGQILSTYEIDNYPGMRGVSGMELGNALAEHAGALGVEIVREAVISLELEGATKKVSTDNNVYETKHVIIATGAMHSKLALRGEDELIGAGISYCATCDGAFYKGETVAVVGGGNVAAEDALFLSKICKEVIMIHRRDELRADKKLAVEISETDNIKMMWDSTVTELIGDGELEAINVTNVKTGMTETLDVAGLFVAVGINPVSDLLKGKVDMDEKGYIIAGEDCATSVSGVYAAGDVRKKKLRQVVTAVADGANAVNSIVNG